MLEKLIEVLGTELTEQVQEKLGDIELGITNDGTLVPADKHDNMKAELKATQERLEGLHGQLKDMESSKGTIEELKEQLKAKGDEFEKFKNDVTLRENNLIKVSALEKGFKEAGALESVIDLLVGTVDLEEVNLDEKSGVSNLQDIINPIKEAREAAFIKSQADDNPPPDNQGGGDEDLDDPQAYFNRQMKKE